MTTPHAELDRTETFPERSLRELDELGMPARYVPARFGGQLDSFADLIQSVRGMARQDLTVAVAHVKTFLGAVSVWLAGSDTQATELAQAIMAGARVSWGLSEPGHGADLLAGELTARPHGDGFALNGTKWPINCATRGSHICVLARTDPAGGPRGFSLFLVDKAALAEGSWRNLPKARTHGLRGADISGIQFDNAAIPVTTLVGDLGGGVETVLRGLQLTRLLCAGLSLGAGEHALRLATAFAERRIVGGRPLIERPTVRAVLARSVAVLLTAEAASVFAGRAVQAMPGELSVISPAVKALVPGLVDKMIGELAELLGAESFMDGEFQKVQRDHRIVGIFDGSTAVNRNALINQFSRLVRGHAGERGDPHGLALAATLGAELPEFHPAALTLFSPNGCGVTQHLSPLAERIGRAAGPDLVTAARRTLDAIDHVHARLAGVRPAARPPASAFRLAADYELAFAAAACLRLWESNRDTATEPLWHNDLWLHLCLRELTNRLNHGTIDPGWHRPDLTDRVVDRLATSVRDNAPISLFRLPGNGIPVGGGR